MDDAATLVRPAAALPAGVLPPNLVAAKEPAPPALSSEPDADTASSGSQAVSAATDSSGAAAAEPDKRAYPAPAALPTQEGPNGIRFDGNDGCRVLLPEGKYRVRLSDLDTGNILYETVTGNSRVSSVKRYYIRFCIEVWDGETQILRHEYSAKDREVLIQLPVGTLGDTMGWFPYAVKFQREHGCKLTVGMAEWLIPLFKDAYPEIEFAAHSAVQPDRYYATYNIGLFFDDEARVYQPCDFRLVGLHRTAGYILGVDPTEEPPELSPTDDTRPIEEPYVCIASQSTTQAKYWNNPNGWRELVKFLKDSGYRVICIDQRAVHGHGIVWNHIPYGAEDQTGDIPLLERARWLRHAAFFIGLSSGLSWLAWAARVPVVMISGFTHPTNEFHSPYRIINYHACNSCWNDVRHRFDHKDFLWCPRHAGTPQQFECTRLITVDQVKAAIQRIPGFAEAAAAADGSGTAKP
ncbi:MAG: autotransporter strand-loop-strand O-heptosyltransferase [Proteobacteria bacterium]|nr:autotransporter strand-loop-strand O-heptosyltransferase [Pseudomonadota bacterium]